MRALSVHTVPAQCVAPPSRIAIRGFRICRRKNCALRHQPRSLALFSCRSRRSRGEAIGRMKMKLIGTPYCLFYTGMPPILLGGSGPNTVCILASSLLTGSVDFPSTFLYHTPLGYSQGKNSRKQGKMQDKIPEISKEKQKLLFRIKRIRGQFAAVERALTAGD